MDTIKGHVESVEAKFGEAIVARDEALVVLATSPGLGPPDLCWLQKAGKSALTGAALEAQGYYHHCLGVDNSSSAAVAAYFASIAALVEPITFLQGFFTSVETKIERGFFCSYDPFTRLDVRCELCIPGGVVCGALDPEGNVHDVTADLWRNCTVAAFLRSELYDAELSSCSSSPMTRQPLLTSPADEARLLSSVEEMYAVGLLPDALEALTLDQAGGCSAEQSDVVLHCVLQYFAKRQRWGTAIDFFARLGDVHPPAALYVAAVQRECGAYDEAISTLSSALDMTPDEPLLMTALAHECLYSDQLETSVRLASKAAQLRPNLRAAWLVLARAYIRQGSGPLAMVALNVMPAPPMPMKELELLHVVPPPDTKATTKPQVQPYDPDLDAAKQIQLEEEALSALPQQLPGALMLGREPLDMGATPDVAPARVTRAVLGAVYTALQEVISVTGWDGFLQLRSGVFVMHADAVAAAAAAQQQQQAAQQLQRQQQEAAQADPLGNEFDAALDHAADMGVAEYPEHLPPGGVQPAGAPSVAVALGAAGGPGGLAKASGVALNERRTQPAPLPSGDSGDEADDEQDGYAADVEPDAIKRVSPGVVASRALGLPGRTGSAASADFEPRVTIDGAITSAVASMPPVNLAQLQLGLSLPAGPGMGPGSQGSGGERDPSSAKSGSRPSVSLGGALAASRGSSGSPVSPDVSGLHPGGHHAHRASSPLGQTSSAAAVNAAAAAAMAASPLPTESFSLWGMFFGSQGGAPKKPQSPSAAQAAAARAGGPLAEAKQRSCGQSALHDCTLLQPLAALGAGRCTDTRGSEWWQAAGDQPRAAPCCSTSGHGSGQQAQRPRPLAARMAALAKRAVRRVHTGGRALLQQHEGSRGPERLRKGGRGSSTWSGVADSRCRYSQARPLLCTGARGRPARGRPAAAGPVAEAPSDDGSSDTAAAASQAHRVSNGNDAGVTPQSAHGFDLDREAVLSGSDPTSLAGKRLCVRWLDELIVALWHDLQAYLDWKALDSELAEAGFGAHADIVAGITPGPRPQDYKRPAAAAAGGEGGAAAKQAPPQLPPVSAVQWLQRGLLAERLHHDADALAAYRAAVSMPPPPPPPGASAAAKAAAAAFAPAAGAGPGAFSMIAWLGITRLAADARDPVWALRAVQAVLAWHDARLPANSSAAGAGGRLRAAPLPVVHCMHLLVAAVGRDGLAAALEQLLGGKQIAGAGPAKDAGGSKQKTPEQDQKTSEPSLAALHPAANALVRQIQAWQRKVASASDGAARSGGGDSGDSEPGAAASAAVAAAAALAAGGGAGTAAAAAAAGSPLATALTQGAAAAAKMYGSNAGNGGNRS